MFLAVPLLLSILVVLSVSANGEEVEKHLKPEYEGRS